MIRLGFNEWMSGRSCVAYEERRKILKFPAMGDSKSYSMRRFGSSRLANGHRESMKRSIYMAYLKEGVKICLCVEFPKHIDVS